jgi:hypothetical protein
MPTFLLMGVTATMVLGVGLGAGVIAVVTTLSLLWRP